MSFYTQTLYVIFFYLYLGNRNTAEDVFGRVEGEFSFTAANTFKLDHWHTLSLIKKHHPLNWTNTQFMDLMKTSQKW